MGKEPGRPDNLLELKVSYCHCYAGILEREQEQSVVYGSIDFGKTVSTCDKYKELVSSMIA
jgi:hypothetical protein